MRRDRGMQGRSSGMIMSGFVVTSAAMVKRSQPMTRCQLESGSTGASWPIPLVPCRLQRVYWLQPELKNNVQQPTVATRDVPLLKNSRVWTSGNTDTMVHRSAANNALPLRAWHDMCHSITPTAPLRRCILQRVSHAGSSLGCETLCAGHASQCACTPPGRQGKDVADEGAQSALHKLCASICRGNEREGIQARKPGRRGPSRLCQWGGRGASRLWRAGLSVM
jgi:hypothetical protein